MKPGTTAIEWEMSVFFFGTGQLIHDVVDKARCVAYIDVAPAPSAAAWRSGRPVTTTAVAGIPSAAATGAMTVPTIEPIGRSGGSRSPCSPTASSSCWS